MRVVDRPSHCLDDSSGVASWQRIFGGLLFEARAVHILEAEEGQGFVFAYFMNLHNMRVLEAGCRLGFGTETDQADRISACPGQDHFQGHQPLQLTLSRLVDYSHTASAQLRKNLVTRQFGQAALAWRDGDEARGPTRKDAMGKDLGT